MLELMSAGGSPYDAVTSLVRDAMVAAEGRVPDLDQLREQIDEAVELAREHNDSPGTYGALPDDIRTTPLDPARPARDLLEDLLPGIRGCWLICQDTADVAEVNVDGDASTDMFIDALRAEANENRDQLL
ncbi:hypothetical protein [Actinomadura rubrisoli]|uniref:Uncharacterized protein n=1 Tax=Actinomadura rubrisoli TaxID=2530368 RepID=A0A4R5BD71_9ACTN|nr:hypothetical protein [Actinomadura rubrisoli]TDD83199.1 hypothetical protein E1298_21625 [Actinomadura rubrisoli]